MSNDAAFVATWKFFLQLQKLHVEFEGALLAAHEWRVIDARDAFDFGHENDEPEGTWEDALARVHSSATALIATIRPRKMPPEVHNLENIFKPNQLPIEISLGIRTLAQNVLLEVAGNRHLLKKASFWDEHSTIATGFRLMAEETMRTLERVRAVRNFAIRDAEIRSLGLATKKAARAGKSKKTSRISKQREQKRTSALPDTPGGGPKLGGPHAAEVEPVIPSKKRICPKCNQQMKVTTVKRTADDPTGQKRRRYLTCDHCGHKGKVVD